MIRKDPNASLTKPVFYLFITADEIRGKEIAVGKPCGLEQLAKGKSVSSLWMHSLEMCRALVGEWVVFLCFVGSGVFKGDRRFDGQSGGIGCVNFGLAQKVTKKPKTKKCFRAA